MPNMYVVWGLLRLFAAIHAHRWTPEEVVLWLLVAFGVASVVASVYALKLGVSEE